MSYRSYIAHPEINAALECSWTLHAEAPRISTIPPDGRPEIVFHLGDLAAERLGGRLVSRPRYAVCGQLTQSLSLATGPSTRVIALRLQPWALTQLFDISSAELTDKSVELCAVAPGWGRELEAIVEWGAPIDETIRELGASVKRRLAERSAASSMCAPAVVGLENGSIAALDGWAATTGASLRTWQRRFRREIGVGPKVYLRMMRFLRWLALGESRQLGPGGLSLADRALVAGYFDQAHVHRDAQQFAGTSPGALVDRALDRTLATFAPLYDRARLHRITAPRDVS